MSQSTKRFLSTIAIVIASVAFGVLVSADLGLLRSSHAQTVAPSTIQTNQGPVTAVTIPSFADVAARAMPAVVSVNTTEIVKGGDMRRRFGFDPFDLFPDPNNPRRRDDDEDGVPQRGGGSGFIISQDGYILTNNHVIDGAAKVEVHFGADENGSGGRTVPAKVVGHDAATDLALLKIDVDGPLPVLPLGDSERIRRGDWAIAIGNPFNLENTLTVGVISAKGRSINVETESRSFDNFIQTDAAINFGNSGGPLMNIRGEVVGINTAIRGGMAQNLGFAIPVNTAKHLIPQLKGGKVTRSYLGMQIQEVTEDLRDAFGLQEARGALVQNVDPGKPADKAGIRHGDVIVEIDGKKVNTNRDLIDYISYLPVGTNVQVSLIRDGKRQTVTAKTAERPNGGEAATANESETAQPTMNKLGISVQDLTPQVRRMYNLGDDVRGVVVSDVKRVSAAADAGIAEGDVISEVQGQSIGTADDLRAFLDRAKSGQRIRVYVTSSPRGGSSISGYRVIQVP
jgi:serine protease Do